MPAPLAPASTHSRTAPSPRPWPIPSVPFSVSILYIYNVCLYILAYLAKCFSKCRDLCAKVSYCLNCLRFTKIYGPRDSDVSAVTSS